MASKRHLENLKLIDLDKKYTPDEALALLEQFKSPKFDETVNMAFRLGVDTRQADQQVRGAATLPNGVGKKVRVLVFAKGPKAKDATDSGADFVGADDLVEKIQGGWLDFDKVIATPDMMPVVSKVARVLGPRGMMPNPKLGTVTMDVKKAVDEELKGKVEFRAEKAGIVHVSIGKKSFGADKLKENLAVVVENIMKLKPSSSKGSYVRSATLSGAMSPGISLDTNLTSQLTKGSS